MSWNEDGILPVMRETLLGQSIECNIPSAVARICPEKTSCTRKQIGYTFINSVLSYRDLQLRDFPYQRSYL